MRRSLVRIFPNRAYWIVSWAPDDMSATWLHVMLLGVRRSLAIAGSYWCKYLVLFAVLRAFFVADAVSFYCSAFKLHAPTVCYYHCYVGACNFARPFIEHWAQYRYCLTICTLTNEPAGHKYYIVALFIDSMPFRANFPLPAVSPLTVDRPPSQTVRLLWPLLSGGEAGPVSGTDAPRIGLAHGSGTLGRVASAAGRVSPGHQVGPPPPSPAITWHAVAPHCHGSSLS